MENKVKIKALAGNAMEEGKIYIVSESSAEFLIKSKRAVKAKEGEKVGKVYGKKTDITN